MKERYLTDKPQNKTLLESLVAGIDTHNLHREVNINTGKVLGNEEW